ncbi:MAG TPA: hypothetical protein VG456_01345 [Candidatus Sulfopaludibacter sp.]|jgi:hypothetical protein|nr:hypothetical protein [Candidatus Sulfopaludibacter sp.]
MAKFKPAKGKSKNAAAPQGGLPCVILVIVGMILVMLFLYFVMAGSSTK